MACPSLVVSGFRDDPSAAAVEVEVYSVLPLSAVDARNLKLS